MKNALCILSRKNLGQIIIVITLCMLIFPEVAAAQSDTTFTQDDLNSIVGQTPFYDPNALTTASPTVCTTTIPISGGDSNSNLDYAGAQILTSADLKAISQNEPTYEQAAQQAGIPWEMLAALHYEESGLTLSNPTDNANGIYQITGTNYPEGEAITQADFLQQSIVAANFLKSVASSNLTGMQTLTASTTDADTIKDTFFGYNGRAQAYASQAASLGYSATLQPFEGSPYVMNRADAKRDPGVQPTESNNTWGQIKTNGSTLTYPADDGYGAYIIFADLSGISPTSGCSGVGSVNCNGPTTATQGLSQVRQNVVCIAEQQEAEWSSADPSTAFHVYSQGNNEEWCADFVSWVYNQAGDPLGSGSSWRVSGVMSIQAIGAENQNFKWHNMTDPTGADYDPGYTPVPGDMAIHNGIGSDGKPIQHVNIVTGVSGNQVTLVGGDQDNAQGTVVNWGTDSVPGGAWSIIGTEGPEALTADAIIGYVSPN